MDFLSRLVWRNLRYTAKRGGLGIRTLEFRCASLNEFGLAKTLQENELGHNIAIMERRHVGNRALSSSLRATLFRVSSASSSQARQFLRSK
jgi:hypothetical protein